MAACAESSSMIFVATSRLVLMARSPSFSNSRKSRFTALWSSLSIVIASMRTSLPARRHIARLGIWRKNHGMGKSRFNHMELTFPPGTLTDDFKADVDAFYTSVFGWRTMDTEVVGRICHLLLVD